MRNVIRLILPVAVLVFITGMLPVLPTEINRNGQLAQLNSVIVGGGDNSQLGQRLIERQEELLSNNGLLDADSGSGPITSSKDPFYYQIVPPTVSSPAASASSGSSGSSSASGGSSTGTSSSGDSTGSSPTSGSGSTPVIRPQTGNTAGIDVYTLGNQVIEQQFDQQNKSVVNSSVADLLSEQTSAPSSATQEEEDDCHSACDKKEADGKAACLKSKSGDSIIKCEKGVTAVAQAQYAKCAKEPDACSDEKWADASAQYAENGKVGSTEKTHSSASSAGSGSVQVWIPQNTNIVSLSSGEDSLGSQGGSPVLLLPGTASVSLSPQAGYVPVQIAAVRTRASDVIVSSQTGGGNVLQVEKAGDLLSAIAVNAANEITGTTQVKTVGGAEIIVPTVKTAALSVIGQGVGAVFSNIGDFFGSLFGDSVPVSVPQGSGLVGGGCSANRCAGPCVTADNLPGTCVAGASDEKVCVSVDPDSGACLKFADPGSKDQTGTVMSVPTCTCQVSSTPVPVTGPNCPAPKTEYKKYEGKASAELTTTILLSFPGGPKNTDPLECVKWDANLKDLCLTYAHVHHTDVSIEEIPSQYVSNAPSEPVAPAANAPQAEKNAYEKAKKEYEENKNKGNVGEVRQRSDSEMRAILIDQIKDILANPSAENEAAGAAWSAAVDAALANLLKQINGGAKPDCSLKCDPTAVCGVCGMVEVVFSDDLVAGKVSITITGFKTGESNTPHTGAPTGSQIAGGLFSVDVKIKQDFSRTAVKQFDMACGATSAPVDFPKKDAPAGDGGNPPPAPAGGGGVASGGGPEVVKPNPVPPPPPEPPQDPNPPVRGWGFFDNILRALKNALGDLNKLFPGGVPPVDDYAPVEEPPIEEPPVPDDSAPPVGDEPPAPESTIPFEGPTTDVQLRCQPRSEAAIKLLEDRENARAASDTGYVKQKISKCTGGSDCGNGQKCGETASGGCACLAQATPSPAAPPVTASPAPKPDDTKTEAPAPKPQTDQIEIWRKQPKTCASFSPDNVQMLVGALRSKYADKIKAAGTPTATNPNVRPYNPSEDCLIEYLSATDLENADKELFESLSPWHSPNCSFKPDEAKAALCSPLTCTNKQVCSLNAAKTGCECATSPTKTATPPADGKTVAPGPKTVVPPPAPAKLVNCKLTNNAVGFTAPQNVLTFTDLSGAETKIIFEDLNKDDNGNGKTDPGEDSSVRTYDDFAALSDEAKNILLNTLKTPDGKTIKEAADARGESACGANSCSTGGGSSKCGFKSVKDYPTLSLAERCYCPTVSATPKPQPNPTTTVAPPNKTPAPPPAQKLTEGAECGAPAAGICSPNALCPDGTKCSLGVYGGKCFCKKPEPPPPVGSSCQCVVKKYGRPNCSNCSTLSGYLSANGIPYKEYNIDAGDPPYSAKDESTGQCTVLPWTIVDCSMCSGPTTLVCGHSNETALKIKSLSNR